MTFVIWRNMNKTLTRLIENHDMGIFLLDPPTGFGKTTEVIDIISRFLKGDSAFSKVKRMYFVTNLLGNLPYEKLKEKLSDEERKQIFWAKATNEYVIDRLLQTNITHKEILSSNEYERLKDEIESLKSLKEARDKKDGENFNKPYEILKRKISTDTEPAFRKLIKNQFFYNKSVIDRRKFIEDNGWFRYLYPICEIEKYKVIFLSTKKFIGPIDTFKRLPFYFYEDDIIKDSVVFIDEFDSTKQVVLDQIIDDGLKNQIDIVGLFSDLHYALQNIVIPNRLFETTDYNKAKVESGEWYTIQQHFDYLKKIFKEKYEEHNIKYLIKSVEFDYDKAFLFDDGRYFNVIKDNSKKFICANVDKKENFLALRERAQIVDDKEINKILRDLLFCIEEFEKCVFYIYNNYMYYKNSMRKGNEIKFSDEEAIFTVLDILNLSDEQKGYLFRKLKERDFRAHAVKREEEARRGFSFTVIEDSNYHDMKSIARNYIFSQSPEDILIKLAKKALVVGISATAKIETCIGNYDQKYIRSKLKEGFIDISDDDQKRIELEFENQQSALRGQYTIHASIIDDFDVFSDKEKCEKLIESLFKDELKDKYNRLLRETKIDPYYFAIELKLTYLYSEICQKNIKSFIAFVNSFPRPGGKFDSDRLQEMFNDLVRQDNFESINFEIVRADNFDAKFKIIRTQLANNETVFVLTAYNTIGSGKNIQYDIPNDCNSVVRINDERNDKDFEGIYLLTPTNLIQWLNNESENKYKDLSRYLFHQEYLYLNNKQTYLQMKSNIIAGFRKVFFNENYPLYTKNKDMQLHMLKIANQATGRICRCRNKNKNIYIYCDSDLTDNLKLAYKDSHLKMLNDEFMALLNVQGAHQNPNRLEKYSKQSKANYCEISKASRTLRSSAFKVQEWKELRDFVLKNPTTDNPGKYEKFYFAFDSAYSGYSYAQNGSYDIVRMRMDTRADMEQVSEAACDLPAIMDIPKLPKFFKEKGYATQFKKAKFIMSPSFFKRVYLGALGEVVGKFILEDQLGWNLEDLSDYTIYEFFDYQLGDLYFDFKHWNKFRTDNNAYTLKVESTLKRANGKKCFAINILKRNDAKPKINISENVIQIPYLFDPETGLINDEAIDYIFELC